MVSKQRPLLFRWPIGLVVALFVAVALHGALLISGSYRGTFDAYIHLFFADHYRRSWFSSFEPRWYTGFSVFSYPPGAHQSRAVVSQFVGLEFSFVLVSLFAVLFAVVGTYRFARLWVSAEAAGYAALLMTLSSSLAESLHVFGQLPTLLAVGFLLNGLPFVYRWIRYGGAGTFSLAILACAATTAVHHVTTIFGSIFFVGPVIVRALLDCLPVPIANLGLNSTEHNTELNGSEPNGESLERIGAALGRALTYGIALVCSVAFVVLPYWLWSRADPIAQVPIPHASRDNFLTHWSSGFIFLVIPWGALAFLSLQSVRRGLRSTAWPLALSVALAALLGTGGTTPLPRLLLGEAFNVLTLDRFTLWATFLVLPLGGATIERLLARVRSANWSDSRSRLTARFQVGFLGLLLVSLVAMSVLTANLSRFRPSQPQAIDPAPIVRFMAKESHDRWRYLTLGFGDQMAWLSAHTTAESVDGNYHSARRLPELTSTPVERLEAAKYKGAAGLSALQQIVGYPEKYHLKFVFSNDRYYDPLLDASGWQRLEPLNNGIAVWVREGITAVPQLTPSREAPIWQRFLWGTVPIVAISFSLLTFCMYAFGMRVPVRVTRIISFGSEVFNRRLRMRKAQWVAGHVALQVSGRIYLWLQVVRASEYRYWVRTLLQSVRRRLNENLKRVALAALCVGVLGSAGLMVATRSTSSPEKALYAYYSALDNRDTDTAFDLLTPDTRPEHDQFVRGQALANGLVASYAKLTGIAGARTSVDNRDPNRADVTAKLNYVTAFSDFWVPVHHTLRRIHSAWKLDPPQIDASTPPEQLVVRPGVAYFDQGRRDSLALTTPDADLLDRPGLDVVSARLVRVKGEFSIVGEVINVDVAPARLTVNASLIGHDGRVLGRMTNAMTSMQSALPGERVPFRVDFAGVSGRTTFDHSSGLEVARPLVPKDLASVEVSISSVAAHSDVDRSLMIDSAQRIGDTTVVVTYRNDGLEEVTVPHSFLTLRLRDGSVGWVQSEFLSKAIRPERTDTNEHQVLGADQVELIDVPLKIFTDRKVEHQQISHDSFLPGLAGWSGVDINIVGFTRTPG